MAKPLTTKIGQKWIGPNWLAKVGPKFRFFPSPAPIFALFCVSLGVFSWNFGGVFEVWDPQMCTFGSRAGQKWIGQNWIGQSRPQPHALPVFTTRTGMGRWLSPLWTHLLNHKMSPTTMPRTPPIGFTSAVMRPRRTASTCLCANLPANLHINWVS